MIITRRKFLGGGAAALALGVAARTRLASARGLLLPSELEDVVGRALDAAKQAGATYADVRVHRRRAESLGTRDDHIEWCALTESYGLGVRVIAGGAWGFAASSRVVGAEAARVAVLAVEMAKANARAVKRPVALAPVKAHVDVWQTPLEKDPFKIPVEDKAEMLLGIAREALKVPGVKHTGGSADTYGEWKLFASSEGASLEQDLTRIAVGYNATAIDGGRFESRSHDFPETQAGWEAVERSSLVADARRTGEEAMEKLKAPSVSPGKKDLVLAPSHLALTIHESVGHPTELDRALGYEANAYGTSFLGVDQLGKLKYASPLVTIWADKTTPTGLATCGYDDDGVKTTKWDLVRDGVFVGWQTTRELAGAIGEKESRGCSYAEDFRSFPFQRMPNVSLAPGKVDLGLADLVAATEDGILITGMGSFSIDHQRKNFQFGGQTFHAIKKGKVAGMLRDVAYQASTLDFWRSCDLVGGRREWQMFGLMFDGKGEPQQSNPVSHGCPPARFRGVNVLNTAKESAS